MSHVVKPQPAGTKETADVSSVKVSSMKSMFEKSKKSEPESAAPPPRRRQLRGNDWANGNDHEGASPFVLYFCLCGYFFFFTSDRLFTFLLNALIFV